MIRKVFVFGVFIGAILASLGLNDLRAQCSSALSFGLGQAPVTALDTVVFGPCVLFTDFATINGIQAGETYAITMSTPTFLSIYNGSNAVAANLVTSGLATNTLTFTAPASGNYEVTFYANNACPVQFAPGCQSARVSCESCVPPIETDSCVQATLVGGGNFAFSSQLATGQDISSCGSGDSIDVWVKYSPPTDGTVTMNTCESGFNTTLQVFDGCPCDGGMEVSCNDDHVGLPSIGGARCADTDESGIHIWMRTTDTFFIRVAGVNGAAGSGRLNIIDPVVASGVLCSNAPFLQSGSTVNANLSTLGGTFTTRDQLCSNGGNNSGMFFRFEVPSCGTVELEINHASSNFNWFILSGDCSSQAISSSLPGTIASSGCSGGTNPVVFKDSALWMGFGSGGTSYTYPREYVLFVEASGAQGPISVSYDLLNSSPPPAHDRCDSAYNLTSGDGFSTNNNLGDAHSGSVSCANTDPSDDNTTVSITPASGCVGGNITWRNSLWYEWTAPTSNLYTIDIFNQNCLQNPQSIRNGLEFMVTTVKDCKDPAKTRAGAMLDLAGNSCYARGTTTDVSFTFQTTASTTYYIVINGADGAMCDFDLLVSEETLLWNEAYDLIGQVENSSHVLRWSLDESLHFITSFDIQRSKEGMLFETIGKLDRTANLHYEFRDEQPYPGTQLYRLKALSADGQFFYSKTIELTQIEQQIWLSAMNNGQELQVSLGEKQTAARLEILTADGKVVLVQSWGVDAPREQILRPHLSSGLYLFRLSNQETMLSGKFIRR